MDSSDSDPPVSKENLLCMGLFLKKCDRPSPPIRRSPFVREVDRGGRALPRPVKTPSMQETVGHLDRSEIDYAVGSAGLGRTVNPRLASSSTTISTNRSTLAAMGGESSKEVRRSSG